MKPVHIREGGREGGREGEKEGKEGKGGREGSEGREYVLCLITMLYTFEQVNMRLLLYTHYMYMWIISVQYNIL